MILIKISESKRRRAGLRKQSADSNASQLASERKLALEKKASPTESADQTANALLAIVILFLLCELPVAFLLFASVFNLALFPIILFKVKYFVFMIRLLNASLNFILYCFMSALFRTTFMEIFGNYLILPSWLKKSKKIKIDHSDASKKTESIEMA